MNNMNTLNGPHNMNNSYGKFNTNYINTQTNEDYWRDDVIANEHKSNYIIFVDGTDRDKSYYPNPYKLIVGLGSTGTKVAPYVDRPFRNVKYVKLHYVMLPRYIVYDLTVGGDGFRTYAPRTTGTFLAQYRYLLLRIKELDSHKTLSTGNNFKDECYILLRDSFDSDAVSDVWKVTQHTRVFNNNDLKNLTRLTIEIFDPNGNQIALQAVNGPTTAPISSTDINNPDITQTNFGSFVNNIEISLNIEVGVCESELNMPLNYR
jgi:hypothetical protein